MTEEPHGPFRRAAQPTARAFAARHGDPIKLPQELRAMGASSVLAGVSGTMPVGASNSRTAVNDAMGASSQVAALLGANRGRADGDVCAARARRRRGD